MEFFEKLNTFKTDIDYVKTFDRKKIAERLFDTVTNLNNVKKSKKDLTLSN